MGVRNGHKLPKKVSYFKGHLTFLLRLRISGTQFHFHIFSRSVVVRCFSSNSIKWRMVVDDLDLKTTTAKVPDEVDV